jgi:hypothetical protein
MLDNRRHLRLREFLEVAWELEGGQGVSGQGSILNISTSGVLLQTDRVFQPTDHCVLSIGPGTENLPFLPKKGKLMWFRRIYTPQERFQCGVQFLPEKIDKDFRQWFEAKIKQLSETTNTNILSNLAF